MRSKLDFAQIGSVLSDHSIERGTLAGQIATTLRYLIATSQINPGDALPALRHGAALLGVNMHTLRQAYQLLREEGYIEIIPSVGVRASDQASIQKQPRAAASLNDFLGEIEWEARIRFGLEPGQLARLLAGRARQGEEEPVSFIECSLGQADMHARQVGKLIGRPCRPVVIDPEMPAPAGNCITTLFHLGDIERAWPGRIKDYQCIRIKIADEMGRQVKRELDADRQVVVCEFNHGLGRQIANDLAELSGHDRAQLPVQVIASDDDNRQFDRPDAAHFFAPRVWNRLPGQVTARKNFHQIVYDIHEDDARQLAGRFGTRPEPDHGPLETGT